MSKSKNPNINFTVKIPYEFMVGIYITIIIILSLLIYLNRHNLHNSYFKNTYFIYYIGFVLNLLNMIIFTIYYNKKKTQIQGTQGPQGYRGKKGDRGKFITCSFCEHNLYFLKTKKYNTILTMKVGLTENENNQLNKDIMGYTMSKEMEYFNLNFLKNIYEISQNNKVIKTLQNIFKFSTRMKYLSYNLNKNIKKGDINENITFLRPIGGNGYFPIGHSVLNSELANKLNSFLINGDIDFPEDYKIKFTFRNVDILDRQGKDASKNINMDYSFIQPIPKKDFVSLGELIIRNNGGSTINTDINLAACIRKSCAKKISIDLLELMAIKISYKTDDDKVNRILNYSQNYVGKNTLSYNIKKLNYDTINHENLDIYSIWKTPLNTFVTNCIVANSNIINGTLGYNILDGNNTYLEDNGFNINNKGIQFIKKILNNIELPKIIRIIYIVMNQYHQFFKTISYYLKKIIPDLQTRVKSLNKPIRKSNKQKKIDRDKTVNITQKISLFENLIKNIDNKDIFTDFDNLFDKETQLMLEENLPDIEQKREILNNIPYLIETKTTLYDMLMYLFPDGLNTIIAIDKNGLIDGGMKPNKLQYEFIKISKVCFPPNIDIYIPKDECMSYNNIDLERRKLLSKVDYVLSDYESLYKKNDNKCDNWDKILNKIAEIEEILLIEFSHIKKYKTKIEKRDLDIFSNSRLQLIINSYQKLNDYIKQHQC